jgi:hypothetical protein
MAIDRITYSIKPSFAESSFCEIQRNVGGNTYGISVEDKKGRRQIRVTEEAVLPIADAVARLRLPVPTDVLGLDGTIYSLTIGTLTSVTYSWWMSLPAEWAALQEIIAAIKAISGIMEQEA